MGLPIGRRTWRREVGKERDGKKASKEGGGGCGDARTERGSEKAKRDHTDSRNETKEGRGKVNESEG